MARTKDLTGLSRMNIGCFAAGTEGECCQFGSSGGRHETEMRSQVEFSLGVGRRIDLALVDVDVEMAGADRYVRSSAVNYSLESLIAVFTGWSKA